MKKIGIVGTRSRDTERDFELVKSKFEELYVENDRIVSGGCTRGGDRFAEKIAREKDIKIIIYYADWDRYGKGAGFFRNTYIARDCDILIACVSADRTGGTEDTIRKFLKTHEDKDLYLV